jgi:hypothetical protein
MDRKTYGRRFPLRPIVKREPCITINFESAASPTAITQAIKQAMERRDDPPTGEAA